jgi:hypothetical protein
MDTYYRIQSSDWSVQPLETPEWTVHAPRLGQSGALYLGSTTAELPTIHHMRSAPSINSITPGIDDASLLAAVELIGREISVPTQGVLAPFRIIEPLVSAVELISRDVSVPTQGVVAPSVTIVEPAPIRIVEPTPQLQYPSMVTSSASTSSETFLQYQIPSLNPSNTYSSSLLTLPEIQLPAAVKTHPPIEDMEITIRYLEDERQALQYRLDEMERERSYSQSKEIHGSLYLQSLQSSVKAMQETMSQQAAELGGLQQQLSQQQREAQAWMQQVQGVQEQLRLQREEQARELNNLRGARGSSCSVLSCALKQKFKTREVQDTEAAGVLYTVLPLSRIRSSVPTSEARSQ